MSPWHLVILDMHHIVPLVQPPIGTSHKYLCYYPSRFLLPKTLAFRIGYIYAEAWLYPRSPVPRELLGRSPLLPRALPVRAPSSFPQNKARTAADQQTRCMAGGHLGWVPEIMAALTSWLPGCMARHPVCIFPSRPLRRRLCWQPSLHARPSRSHQMNGGRDDFSFWGRAGRVGNKRQICMR